MAVEATEMEEPLSTDGDVKATETEESSSGDEDIEMPDASGGHPHCSGDACHHDDGGEFFAEKLSPTRFVEYQNR